MTPDMGKTVKVWPHPGAPVRSHGPDLPNRYLPADGIELPWSPWLEEIHGQGLCHLTDPSGSKIKPALATVTEK